MHGMTQVADRSPIEKEAYLEAIVELQRRLLRHANEERLGAFNEALEPLGRASGASRVYLFENHWRGEELLMSQRAEWCAPGISPELDNPELQSLSYDDFFPRWAELMKRGQRLEGEVATFPQSEREILEPQGILSILVLPLIVDDAFIGFIGFDHCQQVHHWSRTELHLLEAAASHISLLLDQRRAQRELRELHDELLDARDRALAASHAKSTFMAKISHELRTPLNAIIGYSEILLELPEEEAAELQPHLADVSAIHTSGRHLLSIIDDLLDLSSAEAGKITTSPTTFELSELVHDTQRMLPILATRTSQVSYRVELPMAPLGAMVSDHVRLRQVLFNLLSNAFKYTPSGEVRYAVELPDEAHVRFVVEDTGIGIAPEHHALVFEPFAQIEDHPRRMRDGTGLGLAVARHLCELLGAELELHSTLGQGARFTVTCPRLWHG